MNTFATWIRTELTADGPEVVEALTDEEMNDRSASPICVELATLPSDAHLDMRALAKILRRSTKSVERAVRRGDLPAPFTFLGKNTWLVGTIVQHLRTKQEAVAKLAAKRAAQLDRHVA